MSQLDVGDVVLTRSKGWVGWFIRFGAALLDRPNIHNHAIIVHHRDEAGTLWGVEGKPGGVGWVNMTSVMKDNYTVTNAEQPKTLRARATVAEALEAAIKVPYDWGAIAEAASESLHLDLLWRKQKTTKFVDFKDNEVPGHVICSALADWAYERAGIPNPGGSKRTRFTTPADWDLFIIQKGWENPDAARFI